MDQRAEAAALTVWADTGVTAAAAPAITRVTAKIMGAIDCMAVSPLCASGAAALTTKDMLARSRRLQLPSIHLGHMSEV